MLKLATIRRDAPLLGQISTCTACYGLLGRLGRLFSPVSRARWYLAKFLAPSFVLIQWREIQTEISPWDLKCILKILKFAYLQRRVRNAECRFVYVLVSCRIFRPFFVHFSFNFRPIFVQFQSHFRPIYIRYFFFAFQTKMSMKQPNKLLRLLMMMKS